MFELAFPTAVNLSATLVGLFMFGLWLVQLKTRNAGIVDVGWTLSLVLTAVLCATFEEGRYQQLREEWRDHPEVKFLAFFLVQGFLAVALSLPFWLACRDPRPGFAWWEGAAVLLWIVGQAGVALADFQLDRFKTNRENRGRVCQDGLWNYSRHPNYFFEIVLFYYFEESSHHAKILR